MKGPQALLEVGITGHAEVLPAWDPRFPPLGGPMWQASIVAAASGRWAGQTTHTQTRSVSLTTDSPNRLGYTPGEREAGLRTCAFYLNFRGHFDESSLILINVAFLLAAVRLGDVCSVDRHPGTHFV